MRLCEDYGPLDFEAECVRTAWGALLPTIIVFSLSLWSIPLPCPPALRQIFENVAAPLRTYLTLDEAEAMVLREDSTPNTSSSQDARPLGRSVFLMFTGILECFCWTVYGSLCVYSNQGELWMVLTSFLKALSWLYTVVRTIIRPTASAPMDVFAIYVMFAVGSILQCSGVLYERIVLRVPLPSGIVLLGLGGNLTVIIILLIVVANMPLAIPRNKFESHNSNSSPEDYTTLWKWITFSWVYPLIRRGTSNTLNEKDVWELSPTMRSRPVFTKFSTIHRPTLLRRLWAANSMDLIWDFILTYVSVIFNYAGPFFLKQILDLIDLKDPTSESRSKAYIYALLAFVCSLLKIQCDVQHLWFARRMSCRLRSELMAAIYDKALKRKDFSGIVDKEKDSGITDKSLVKDKNSKSKDKVKKGIAKEDEPKAGADIGKIVNLMAGDTNRIARTATSLFSVYSAPFEILIAGTFLYKLLGWSAFAGFVVLLVGWPLNSYLTRRSVRIQKGVLGVRDKRMGVINELLRAVKFIKFFAWEERWISKALDAREAEMKWMTKARTNSVMLHFLWTCAPIMVSIISFTTYVLQGNELTIGTAFTAIALFNMVRAPLNVLPTWLVQILQTGIALKRIEVYLDEEEVADQVSSLKKAFSDPRARSYNSDEEGLGLQNATCKWNEVTGISESNPGKKIASPLARSESSQTMEDSDTVVQDSVSERDVDDRDRAFELRDISVSFPEGELTVVTGPTASGKTALLLAVLGELTLLSGNIIMSKDPSRVDKNGLMHSISYVAQTPWLRHQSIKDNILFGYPYDEERYNMVVECCALGPDLEMLEDGDQTEIGARGVNLSGGQKARVALARAVYARTKYVLLDDPLSAVDSHTARFLYEQLLRGPLLAKRTVVLVTHHVDLVLPGAYYLIRMLDGRIDTQGTVNDLRDQGILEKAVLDELNTTHLDATEITEAQVIDSVKSTKDVSEISKKPRKLVKDEFRATGGVKWLIYKSYLQASSYWTWVVLLIIAVIMQLLGVTEKLWIKTWGEAYRSHTADATAGLYTVTSFMTAQYEPMLEEYHSIQRHVYSNTRNMSIYATTEFPNPSQHPLFYLGIYASIGLGSALFSVLSVIAQYTGALRASRILFRRLVNSVMRATFRFHDTTPQGRLLNRFGKDVEAIDSSLAGSLQSVNSSLAGFFASVITISIVFPYFLVPATLLGFVYRKLAVGYLNTGRDLRRMESNSRSPIFSHFGELLEGIVTVRAFSAEKRFLDDLHTKLDTTIKMYYNFWMTNRWLLLNFDALGAVTVLITTVFSISALNGGAGLAGLCISSSMTFTTSVYWACRFWTTLELDLNAVERIVEYLDLPQEPPAVIESNRVPAYWPSQSTSQELLRVESLEIKYAPDLPAVLKNISFSLRSGERVGLLGRTGSGKSTLAMSILRFVDPTVGRIVIDGIDISTIGIHDLRSRITFIPQDATLFSGTIRDNLDPFSEHEDKDCLDVLKRVHIISDNAESGSSSHSTRVDEQDTILDESASITTADVDSKTMITLDTKVSPGGANFSQGQRQLIAMARALLRRSSIIVLDEATSSIDFETDAKIQATIREEFTNTLLLTVAHRLRTIVDYDRLIVLERGEIAELDTPWNLINKEDGIFRDMCLKSGSFVELAAAAKDKTNSVGISRQ